MSKLTGLTTIRLLPWHRWLCYAVWWLLLLTGVWWWIDQDLQMNDPAERAIVLIKLHGVMAALALMLFGSLLSTHVRVAWQRRRNRGLGLLALLSLLLLCVSGVGLYYASYELREVLHGVHFWLGLGVALLLPLHIIIGRYGKKRSDTGALLGRHIKD